MTRLVRFGRGGPPTGAKRRGRVPAWRSLARGRPRPPSLAANLAQLAAFGKARRMVEKRGSCAVCGEVEAPGTRMSQVMVDDRALEFCRSHAAMVAEAMPETF